MYIKTSIQDIPEYDFPERKANILLDGNEMSFPLPENIRSSIYSAIKSIPLNLYPSQSVVGDVKKAIATFLDVTKANIILGVGSSDLLNTLCASIGEPGEKILIPHPAFSVYSLYIKINDKKILKINLDDDFDINLDEFISVIENHNPKMVILPYPNNPSGNLFSEKIFNYLFQSYKGVICIDEVYSDYAEKSFIKKIDQHSNIVVLRSFSKIGLAGCRLGYLVASENLVGQIQKGVLPYSINALSATAVLKFIEKMGTIKKLIDVVISEREKMYNALTKIPESNIYPSKANFIMCEFNGNASELAQYLYSECSIAVRDFPGDERIGNCLRITVGTPEENELLVKKIYAYFGL